MSKSHDNPTPIVVATSENEEPQETVVQKRNLVQRGVSFVKSHKKGAIAALGLGALVGVSALAGRKTAPCANETQEPLELASSEAETAEDVTDTDTTVA